MAHTPDPGRSELARHWTLDPEIAFLNHGSFGACPAPVLEEQARIRARIEREPVRFFMLELEGLLDDARRDVAAFLGAHRDDLAFVSNATAGVNTVLRSVPLAAGDELLVTDQEYAASRNALDFAAGRAGASVVVAPIPFPVDGPDRVVEALLERVTGRTRLALVDHVTSQTGLVFPVERIVRELHARGVDVLVDGAHGPGMVPVELDRMGAAYYTGNCHKWLCAPKGAAILHVRRDRQDGLVPLALSHGASSRRTDRSRFRLLFDWAGTDDPSAVLCVPSAIRFLGGLHTGGFAELMERNRALALAARAALCRALDVEPPAPESMIGALAAVPIPDRADLPQPGERLDPLQEELFQEHRIEVPVIAWPGPPRRLVRVAGQAYNTLAPYERLADVLRKRFRA